MAHSLQTLQPEVVCQVTEALMLTHGATTVQDVRKELREQGFVAAPAELSAYMSVLAEERDWWSWSEGQDQVYTFGEDTDETVHHFLKKGNMIWQVLVKGRQQIVAEGRVGSVPELSYVQFPSNRHAVAHSYGLTMIQESRGFVSVPVQGVSLVQLYAYRHFVGRTPSRCILSFREGKQTEHFLTTFSLNGQRAFGRMEVDKTVGYAVKLGVRRARQVFEQNGKATHWAVPESLHEKALLLGEVLRERSAFLSSGERLANWSIRKQEAVPELVRLELPFSGLYKAELYYTDGSRLALDYRDFSDSVELCQLIKVLIS